MTDSQSRTPTKPNDEVLWSGWMAKAQQGDEQCYRQLLDSLGSAITSYLRSRFGPLDFLEDCVQECLIAIHQGRHTYDVHRPFRPWMFTIVRHKAIDTLRQRSRQPNLQSVTDEDGGIERLVGVTHGDFEENVAHEGVFAGLQSQFREALVLTKVVGLSISEAAEKLEITEAAMKVRVHRAVKALRKKLDAEIF
ncbi:MAG: sigma-70 family RNA polymerase sigma factor [Cellvibrionaceae bacterium]